MEKGKNALLSVYNKDGIVEFAEELIKWGGYNILSSGGTAKHLADAGVPVTDIADMVKGAAILDHRVVTISREIAAGLLADPISHIDEMKELGIPYIDLVCFDFYPLEEAVNNPELDEEAVISKIDIGGPMNTLAGAKSGRIVVCNTEDRGKVTEWILEQEPNRKTFINYLRWRAFTSIAEYYARAGNYFSRN